MWGGPLDYMMSSVAISGLGNPAVHPLLCILFVSVVDV